jgi:hypothetical protein
VWELSFGAKSAQLLAKTPPGARDATHAARRTPESWDVSRICARK